MQTSLGDVDIELMDTAAPATVANFLNYVTSGAYDNSFIHRSVPGFVIQGGGHRWDNVSNGVTNIPADALVINEFSASRSNKRGTIAMAKLNNAPDSATSQWFFNLADNSANLDYTNGGYTVFGEVIGNGMQVIDAIAALRVVRGVAPNSGGSFDSLPVVTAPATWITEQNLVMINSVSVLSEQSATEALHVVEFYNTNLDHYFITADANEAAAIDNGAAGPGWMRTGHTFKSGGSSQVCRFYGSALGPNSHFYTADTEECAQLKSAYNPDAKSWKFESNDFQITSTANGACPAGTTPVYRAYNNGFSRGVDSNHRIVGSLDAIQEVVARGWSSEGVVMCAPE